ncbi:MAG: hypothetical protein IOD12_12340 [Silvanigrellales bacterium]|jgi:hypothetical protein|nr:hypothetical protein [Silvanigrellales bacterium]
MYSEHYSTGREIPPQTGYWLKLGDAAHALGVSEITLRRKVKCGKLAHDFRGGKYYVYLHKDDATGRFFEPEETLDSRQPRYERTPVGHLSSSSGTTLAPSLTTRLSSTLPSISIRDTRQSPDVDFEGRTAHQRVLALEEALVQKDALVQGLRRTLEDQQTLIAFLEDTIGHLGQAQEASNAASREGQRPLPRITQKRT